MSLMDKIKAMFSGGSDAHDHDHSHAGHDHAHGHDAVDAVPPAPADPMGAPMPPADADERP